MDLSNKDQVTAFLDWVKATEGPATADECEKVVGEYLAENRLQVQSRLELVDLARQRAHGRKVSKAAELAKAKIDSELRFGE